MLFQGSEASVREVAGGWDGDVGGFGTQCRHRTGVSADGRAREEEGEGPMEPGAGLCGPRYPAPRPGPTSSTAAAPTAVGPFLDNKPSMAALEPHAEP